MGLSNVKTKVKDATILDKGYIKMFDCVICDVPCSGLGVVSSKPDILLSKNSQNINSLVELQYKILDTASQYVNLGGSLVYSTCTINKQENECIIKEFLSQHKDFKLGYSLPKEIAVYDSGYGFTTLANISNIEGFFVSRMIRV